MRRSLARALRVGGEFPPPLGDVSCEIVEATSPVQRTFDPPRVLWTFRGHSGYVMLDGTYTDRDDRTRRWPMGPGTYRIRAGNTTRTETCFNGLPPPMSGGSGFRSPTMRTILSSSRQRPTRCRISRSADSNHDPARQRIRVRRYPDRRRSGRSGRFAVAAAPHLPPLGNWPFLKAKSNARGIWRSGRRYIDNAAEIPQANAPSIRKRISVRVHYPASPITTVQDVLLGSDHSVRNTALRGQVLGPGGRPVAGARIQTSVSTATSTSRRDGIWFLYFDFNQVEVPNISVTVTTDSSITLKPRATVVVPSFYFS